MAGLGCQTDDPRFQAAYSRYLTLKAILNAVQSLIDKAMLCTADVEVDWFRDAVLQENGLSHDFQVYSRLRDQVQALRAAQRLKLSPNSVDVADAEGTTMLPVNLNYCLGIHPTDLLEVAVPDLAQQQVINQGLLPEVEDRLTEQANIVAEIFGCKGVKSEEAQRCVESSTQQHKDLHSRVLHLWKLCTEKSLKYLLTMTEATNLLANILNEHKFDNQKVHDETQAEYLVKNSKMLQSKAQVLHAKLLSDTYTTHTLPALQAMAQELSALTANTETVHRQVSSKLSKYTQLGPEMEEIAKKYRTLLEEVQHAEYSLQEFKALNNNI